MSAHRNQVALRSLTFTLPYVVLRDKATPGPLRRQNRITTFAALPRDGGTRMPLTEILLPEFDAEMAATRRVLERAPDGKGAWKPHPKSMSFGRLATLDRKSTRLNSSHPSISY